jgi:hypothetical protein
MLKRPLVRKNGQITVITSYRSKSVINQTEKDQEQANIRLRKNFRVYHIMYSILEVITGKVTLNSMLALAEQFAPLKGIRVDRIARRRKNCLICWFCENCSEFLSPFVPKPAGEKLTESVFDPFAEMGADRANGFLTIEDGEWFSDASVRRFDGV